MSGAQARMADALLGVSGGFPVLLRMPVAAVPGDDAEQLGQATPQFQDVPLGPVVWRHSRSGLAGDMLISATAVESLVGSLAFDSAEVLFRNAAGVLVDGDLLEIVTVNTVEARGEVAVYRLQLRAAVLLAV